MSDFKAKMHKIRFPLELRLRPRGTVRRMGDLEIPVRARGLCVS